MTTGTVVEFDESKGFGTVVVEGAEPGHGEQLFFHCTAIADASRSIAVGTNVVFDIEPGLAGRYEARSLRAPGGPS